MHKGCIAFLSSCVYRGIFKELSVKMKGVVIKSAFYEKVMEEAVMAKKVLKKKRTAKSGVRTENRASGRTYGYIRVSTLHQNDDRQRTALAEQGVPEENIFSDKQSGKDFNRPGYKALLNTIREGDKLIIKSIDRLGRDFNEILEQWRVITLEKKCGIAVLDMKILNTDVDRGLLDRLVSEIMMIALSYVAQTEREMMRQRVQEGMAAAKAKGIHCGRRKKEIPPIFYMLYSMWKEGIISVREAAKQSGVDKNTFKKWISQMEKERKP